MEYRDLDYEDGVINLDEYKDCATPIKKGACGKKYIFDIDGQKYYFKGNFEQSAADADFEYATPVEVRQDIVESFTSSLLRSVGVHDAVNYRLASFEGERGCISKDFKTPQTVKEFSLCEIMAFNFYNDRNKGRIPLDFKFQHEDIEFFVRKNRVNEKIFFMLNVEDIIKEIEKFTQTYGMAFDAQKMSDFLTEMCVVDYFICNDDRNWENITFLMQLDDTTTPKLINAPIYDNGYALGTWYVDNIFSLENDRQDVIALLGLSDVNLKELGGDYGGLVLQNTRHNNTLKNNGALALDIHSLTKQNPHIKNIVDNFVDLDMDKKLDEFEWTNDIETPDKYRDIINQMYSSRIAHYTKRVRKLQKLLDKGNEK